MPEPLGPVLNRLRALILDDTILVRAVGSGRRKGSHPAWRRVELRYVDLKAGRHLQIVRYDQTQAHTENHAEPAGVVDALLAEPFGHWNLDTTTQRYQIRVTKSGEAIVSVRAVESEQSPGHDRAKARLLPEEHPVLVALGISDGRGRVLPSRRAKYRQVEEFLRELSAALDDAWTAGLIDPTSDAPLRVADLGCGNAYLTFAAHAWLREQGIPARVTGVDVKRQARDHNAAVAGRLGFDTEFLVGGIGDAVLDPAPQVVLALHACDTATDDALARALEWEAPVVLAAPCCHKDISRQLRRQHPPSPYALLTRDGILRERFADTLTDALRGALLRAEGYRVDVVEFVDSAHTPRNTLIRAIRTGHRGSREEYDALVGDWRISPRLAELLS